MKHIFSALNVLKSWNSFAQHHCRVWRKIEQLFKKKWRWASSLKHLRYSCQCLMLSKETRTLFLSPRSIRLRESERSPGIALAPLITWVTLYYQWRINWVETFRCHPLHCYQFRRSLSGGLRSLSMACAVGKILHIANFDRVQIRTTSSPGPSASGNAEGPGHEVEIRWLFVCPRSASEGSAERTPCARKTAIRPWD